MTTAGLDPQDEMFGELLSDFLDESLRLIERLNENLLQLDDWVHTRDDDLERCDEDLINEMFRGVHSIKGLSAMLGLEGIKSLTHSIENVLDAARRDKLVFSTDLVQTLFHGTDRLVGMLDELISGAAETTPAEDVVHEISQQLSAATLQLPPTCSSLADSHKSQSKSKLPPDSLTAARSDATGPESQRPTETMRVEVERLEQLTNLADQLAINKSRFLRIAEDMKSAVARTACSANISNARSMVEQSGMQLVDSASEDSTCTLEFAHRLVEQLRTVDDDAFAATAGVQISRTCAEELIDAIHQLEHLATGIQKSILGTRLVEVGPMFSRFRRVVRDISRANEKEIEFYVDGEKTKLDKRMIDELGDPLVHLVRNSADHGIESPAERLAAGKPLVGLISLTACQRSNDILIEVRDDGKGMATDAIRRKALEKGLADERQLHRMTPHEVHQLIWEPGFSTAEQITEVSGRGMGLDIVRAKIEALNGTVELTSEPGIGTTFSIRLPLTLAALPCLISKIQDKIFAIPLDAIGEIVQVASCDWGIVLGKMTASVRGRAISVVHLAELLYSNDQSVRPVPTSSDLVIVVFSEDENRWGLVVDELLGEKEVVVRPMTENEQEVPGIAGATILPDGRKSLIVDTVALSGLAAEMTFETADGLHLATN